MKVAYFSDSYKPYISGVVRSVDLFTQKLRERGDEVYIFAPDYPEAEEEKGVYRFKSIPAFTHPSFRLALPLSVKLTRRLRKIDPDIIHTHSPFLLGLLARIMANRLDIPLVFTYHTLYEEYAHYVPLGESLIRSLALKYSKNYCENSDLIIAPSDYVRKKLKKMGVNTPITVIPTGIDFAPYGEVESDWVREEFARSPEEELLLFVGRLGEEKYIPLLLESFVEIQKKRPETRLILVGDGPVKNDLIEVRDELGLKDKVDFAGQYPPRQVVSFYQACDLFVFTSPTETQGLVLAEAMAGGMPVVSVDAAGAQAIIEDGREGYLVEMGDKKGFVRAVISALDDERKYEKMSKMARDKAEMYSMENVTDRLRDAYIDLIADNDDKKPRQLA